VFLEFQRNKIMRCSSIKVSGFQGIQVQRFHGFSVFKYLKIKVL
jgi:hypothetical protein